MLGVALQTNIFTLIAINGDVVEEIISAHFNTTGNEVSLVDALSDHAQRFHNFMLGPSKNNGYWQKKIKLMERLVEFMQKINELNLSGDYDIKLYENRSTKQTL